MSSVRRFLLTALPKVTLSRLCGRACELPLPRAVRGPLFRWFARRYGASLSDIDGDVATFRSMQEFFRRPLRAGARPLADSPLVWPCDGRIITTGGVHDGRIDQVKGRDYALAELLGDAGLADALRGGSQATIYLAPGDYHRVHAPFDGQVENVTALPGTLFPVNPPATACIDDLFPRNSRHVFRCRLANGTPAAVVMVGAYNVGGTQVTLASGTARRGDELGRFGFGSTVVVVVGAGAARFVAAQHHERVRMGQAAAAPTEP
jgi:phosphatidylserine decarboxylase